MVRGWRRPAAKKSSRPSASRPTNVQAAQQHTYRPLTAARHEIRLAYLLPELGVLGDDDHVPQCLLVHESVVDDYPSYCAVSHAWGNPTDTTRIIVDGSPKNVTRSLRDFLEHATRALKGNCLGTDPYWIDAICINQSDMEEKSQQVQLMREIFSNADHVLIWLGASSYDSSHALSTLKMLAREVNAGLSLIEEQPNGANSWEPPSNEAALGIARKADILLNFLDDHQDETLHALGSLIQRPWWRRVWVQQEAALGDLVNTRLLCGDDSMLWSNVMKALYAIKILAVHVKEQRWHRASSMARMASFLSTMASIMGFTCSNADQVVMGLDSGPESTLAERLKMMAVSGQLEATLPADYIYALLGISSDAQMAAVRPDYSKPLDQLLLQVAEYYFSHEGPNAFWFCALLESHEASPYPSWVPDWTSRRVFRPLNWHPPKTEQRLYSASGFTHDFDYHIQARSLLTAGCRIDIVRDVGGIGWMQQAPEAAPFQYLEAYTSFIAQHSEHVEHLSDFIWRVPIADQSRQRYPSCRTRAPNHLRHAFVELCAHSASGMARMLTHEATAYYNIMQEVDFGRKPFVTEAGRVGLGPETTRAGDVVFVILGVDVPMVLREVSVGRHRVVGEAYVHGVMDGEAMELAPEIESVEMI